MIETRKSNPNKPPRVMVYGVEGVGKSSFGAGMDSPVFITPEGGTDQLSVDEMVGVDSWDSVLSSVDKLITEKHDFRTLVIDSADWIEGLAHKKIIGNSGKSIITCNGGYGTGYRESQKMHAVLIEKLSLLRETKKMAIVITAHAHVRPTKDPTAPEDFDGYEIKCHEMVSSLWREWVDALLFARFRIFIRANDDGAKARAVSDGSRVVFTQRGASFQAKNRYGLNPEYDFLPDFSKTFMKLVRPESAETILAEINNNLKFIGPEILETVQGSIKKAGTDLKKLKAILARMEEILK